MNTQPQVLIVGAGPVGLTLANLLGSEGIQTLLVERNPGTVPEPRAIALDGESLRTLQAAGLSQVVIPSLREGFIADYVNGRGERLFQSDLNPRPYGFCLQNSFDQPTLERQLLEGLQRFACVEVAFSTGLEGFTQDEEGVCASLVREDGSTLSVDARFLVGCDGGRSTVRQQLGVTMEGDRLPQRWLVVDTVDEHLTGEPQCRFFCDPARPAMTMLRPGNERRWEWMLHDDEDEDQMLEEASIRALLEPHTDPDAVNAYRKVVYGFSAVVADRFSDGRVFLAGDAAHMTPPFAGQGLNAGVRDVRNLSWKLVSVLRGDLPQGLLATYQDERHDAARDLVNLAVALGEQIQPTDAAVAAERDAFFAELNQDPSEAVRFGQDMLAPLFDVRLGQGWYAEDGSGGRLLPQPVLASTAGLLDDTLGPGFVALVRSGQQLSDAVTGHALWRDLNPRIAALPPELAGFCDPEPAVLLLRPDRFVLAALDGDERGQPVLDDLNRQLERWGKTLAA